MLSKLFTKSDKQLFQRAFLALTTGLFLTCAARISHGQEVDRSVRPVVPAAAPARIPAMRLRTLKNGIRVAVLEQHELPIVAVRAVVEAPATLEPAGKEGVATLTAQMLAEGTTTMTAEQLLDAFAELGSSVNPTGFTTITRNVDRSLELMADQLLRPAFPQASLDRIRANTAAALRRQKDQPGYLAARVMASAMYGTGHPYERTMTEESVGAITRDDLLAWHGDYYRPQNVAFVVSGDITPAQAVAKLERAFGAWLAGGRRATYDVPAPRPAGATTIYLHDRPGSPQSVIALGRLGPRRDTRDYHALELLNTAFGGAFSSRLNLNLREKHSYTYGAGSSFTWRPKKQIGHFIISSQVAATKTDSALIEVMGELHALRSERPVSDEELAFAKASVTKKLPLAFETVEQIAGLGVDVLRNDLPPDYYNTVVRRTMAVTPAQVRAAAAAHLEPSALAIVVVGDRKTVEPALRAANIAPVVVVDERAKPAEPTP
jgi:predicted Zn-dependent peptidase